MQNLENLKKVNSLSLKLSIKSLKKTRSHDNCDLFSCNIFLGSKKIATFKQDDFSMDDLIEVIDQDKVDKVKKELATIPEYFCSTLNSKTDVTLSAWAFSACCYKEVESQAKREKQRASLNEKGELRLFKKPKSGNYDKLHEHMKKNKHTPLADLSDADATEKYLLAFGYTL